jgi:hypothetical protein
MSTIPWWTTEWLKKTTPKGGSLELYEAGMLSWDIQMTVEEPLSDDKDGVPHGVSDSESESDKDSD